MPRRIRASNLETRTSRLNEPIAKKPIFVKIGPGVGLGYRRNRTAGTWVVRVADGRGANWTEAIGFADDFDDANGATILDYWQAQDKARARLEPGAAMGRKSLLPSAKRSTTTRRICMPGAAMPAMLLVCVVISRITCSTSASRR